FSFLLTSRGEILKIYHDSSEDRNLLSIKRGFADMLGCKLHHKHENLTLHSERSVIDSVNLEENLTLDFKHHDNFNPYQGMRPLPPVSSFTDFDIPHVKAHSKDRLTFTRKRGSTKPTQRPQNITEVITSNIQTPHNARNQHYKDDNINEVIKSSLECMRKEPEKGSHQLSICFKTLVLALERLSINELKNVLDCYLLLPFPKNCSRRADQNHIADALGSLKSEHTVGELSRILIGDKSSERIVDRILTTIAASDIVPSSDLMDVMRKACMNTDTRFTRETRHTYCFALGGFIKNLNQNNNIAEANVNIGYLHDAIGLHDPWAFRMKRSLMSERECIEHDLEKVVLLETLGNAGMYSSFEYIVSHINSTNSQWVKRAGVFALRTFEDEKTLDALHMVAISDEEETVRYEAMLQYQLHPLSLHALNTSTSTAHDVGKRSILEKSLEFKLEAPGVDWRKEIGSKSMGASFGLIMENLLDLKVCK
ncbi:hypothetical protein MAR_020497, partial [Mya arenaria]